MEITALKDSCGQAEKLSQEFGIRVVSEVPVGHYLVFEEGQWVIRNEQMGKNFQIRLDFDREIHKLQNQKIGSKKDLLCRAVNFKGESDFKVFDCSLGLAQDACHLVAFGASVVGCERNPTVYTLIRSALENSELCQNKLQVYFGEAEGYLEDWKGKVQTFYYDPMFENVNKKTLPKKNLAFLRSFDTAEHNMQRVISLAEQLNLKRLVVKRPINGDHLYGKPNITYKGKLVRYDVYTG